MSCRDDECCGFYKFYFKQYKFFIGHDVMLLVNYILDGLNFGSHYLIFNLCCSAFKSKRAQYRWSSD